MLKNYYHAVVYTLSALAFIAATKPSVGDDYVRVTGLAFVVLIVIWTFMSAWIYHHRYAALPEERRQRMMRPYLAWFMGAAFLLALSDNVAKVIGYFGEPLQWDGLPLLYVILATATVWLWPLVRHENLMKLRENHARQTGKIP